MALLTSKRKGKITETLGRTLSLYKKINALVYRIQLSLSLVFRLERLYPYQGGFTASRWNTANNLKEGSNGVTLPKNTVLQSLDILVYTMGR